MICSYLLLNLLCKIFEKMKKSFAFLFVLISTIFFAQNVSNYEYVFVPKKFKDFQVNQYELNNQLVKTLKEKKYKIIQDELLADCSVVKADLVNNSSMFRNKVTLQFTDCKGNLVLENKATSMIKEFDLGFQDALKIASTNVPVSKPNLELVKPIEPEKSSENVAISENKVVENANTEPKKAEVFSNGTINLQKIQTAKDQFILVSSASSLPFATFKNTTKSDVYRVTLENGNSTLGYTENGNLVIEIPTNDGNYKKVIYTRR